MVSETNLFRFAPRELSQSAFWAWVLQSLASTDEGLADVRPVGERLLRTVGAPVPRDSIQVETEHTLESDAGRADIHVRIDGDAEVLIEHKVSADLRPEQLVRYQRAKDAPVYCLFLSTSYDLRKRRGEDGYEGFGDWSVLDADRLLDILNGTASAHPVIEDYRDWLADRVNTWDRREKNALSPDPTVRKEVLDTVQGQWSFMQYVTRDFSANGRQYVHRNSRGGAPWTEFRFVERTEGRRDTLVYCIEPLSDGPVFRLKQWQPEPNPSWKEKKRRRDRLRVLWRECLDAVGTPEEWDRPNNRGRQSSSVARISLTRCNASDLADELAAVHPRFTERVEREFGWPVGRHEYSYDCRECGGEFRVELSISEYGQRIFPPDRCRECGA